MNRRAVAAFVLVFAVFIGVQTSHAADLRKVRIALKGESIAVMFNPREVTVEKGVPWETTSSVVAEESSRTVQRVTITPEASPGILVQPPSQTLGLLDPTAPISVGWTLIADCDGKIVWRVESEIDGKMVVDRMATTIRVTH